MSKKISIPNEIIINKIYVVREHRVMLDKDLAELYSVETKQLKRQVRRNIERFPFPFMFELTKEEHKALRSQIGTLKQGKHVKYAPFVFTEHGILMLSSVLKSEKAIKMSVQIIETFVQLRKIATNYEEIMKKIQQMELQYNEQFSELYAVLKKLLEAPKEKPRVKIKGYKNE